MDRLVQLERAIAVLVDAVKDYGAHMQPSGFDRLEAAAEAARKVLDGGRVHG